MPKPSTESKLLMLLMMTIGCNKPNKVSRHIDGVREAMQLCRAVFKKQYQHLASISIAEIAKQN